MGDLLKKFGICIAILAILVVAILIPYFAWRIFVGVLEWISTQQEQVIAAIVAAVGTVLAGVGAVVYSQQRSKSREIAESHRPKKVALYTTFIRTMIGTLIKHRDAKARGEVINNDEDMQKFFFDFTSEVLLWGSPAVIRKYSEFLSASAGGNETVLLVVDDLVKVMRKDLGNSNWTLERGDLVKILLIDPEKLDEITKG